MNRPSTPLLVHDTTSRCMTNPSNGDRFRARRERGSGRRLSARRHRGRPGGWAVRPATVDIIKMPQRRASQQPPCLRAP